VEGLVEQGRFAVGVGHEEALDHVEQDEGGVGDRVQDRETRTEHESYEHDVDQRGVLVVDQVSRSTIDYKILRNSLGLCVVLILFAAAAKIEPRVIHEPVDESKLVPYEEFDDWPENVVDH